jgi:iron(III) transport system permease protein
MGVLLWLEHRAQSRLKLQAVRAHTHKPSQSAYQLRGALAWCATVVCALPVLLGGVLPLAILTHSWWQTLGHTPLVSPQLGHWVYNSVALGVITAILAVALAWGITSWQRLSHEPMAKLVFQLGSLGYAVPGAVVVIGLLLPLAWVQQQWPQSALPYVLTATWTGLIWAYLVRFMCIALQTTQSGLTRIPLALDDNARLLGHSNASIAQRIHWPLLQRPLAAAGLLVMIDVIKELPVTLVLRPFDTDTLAVVAYQLARDERLGEAALPCLVLVLIGLIPVLLMNRQLERR